MKARLTVSTENPWESFVGYSRAIRIGELVEVAGTTAVQGNEVLGGDDPYLQTVNALRIIEESLTKLGARLSDVIRTRMFVTDISQWRAIGKAHGEFFGDVRPVATMVEVKALIDPRLLVEIEVEAIVHQSDG
ncbi:MAG: RidA family protein [Firmicutes bacterium]|jgi:enamine deaminase RidA (YjgF/YER057c/UK114 family)|nr:RidA family protein [Bacillota bacterium]